MIMRIKISVYSKKKKKKKERIKISFNSKPRVKKVKLKESYTKDLNHMELKNETTLNIFIKEFSRLIRVSAINYVSISSLIERREGRK